MPLTTRCVRNLLLLMTLLVWVGCDSDGGTSEQPPPAQEEEVPLNVSGTIEDTPTLSTFHRALEVSGIAASLEEAGPYTVFAPSDEAFAESGGSIDALLAREDLDDVLGLHIVPGLALLAAELTSGRELLTLSGDTLTVIRSGSVIGLDTNDPDSQSDVRIRIPDTEATNGVVHQAGGVLVAYVPPPLPSLLDLLRQDEDLRYYAALVDFDGLDSLLASDDQMTLFAPNNDGVIQLAKSVGWTPEQLVTSGLANSNGHIVPDLILTEDHFVPGNRYETFASAEYKNDTYLQLCFVEGPGGAVGLRNGDFDFPFARIVSERVSARNGVLFKIDGYLLGSITGECR